MEVEDPKLGQIKIQAWHKLHFRQAANQKLSLIRVEQLDSRLPKQKTKLAWSTPAQIEDISLKPHKFFKIFD